MRLFLQNSWLKREFDRIQVTGLSDVADYHIQVATKLLDQSPGEVTKELAPLYLYASQMSEAQLAGMDDLRLKAAAKIRAMQEKAKAEVAEKEKREKQLAEQRKKEADAREAEWKLRQESFNAERKRLSDPKIVSRTVLCRSFSDLDSLYEARAHEAAVEAVSGVADLTTKRIIGERIVSAKSTSQEWSPRFQAANGHAFDRGRDCGP